MVFAPGDAQYHVRRALYSWMNFPALLFRDAYLNYPDGAAISWPPLFDFTLAGLGRVFTRDPNAFQVFAAWATPLIGALTLFPVYALARRMGGSAVGVGAATLLALLPIHVTYSRVGQFDHHCAVALIGACWLLLVARLAANDGSSVRLGVGLFLVRLAMLLTWHGSLLYLVLAESTLWLAGAFSGRRELYRVQATSACATAAVLAPLVWVFPEPLAGAWSAIALSRVHVLAVVLVTVVSAGLWWLEGRAGHHSPSQRLAWTAGLGLLSLAGVAALPFVREGLEPGLRFLSMTDGVGARTGEQLPLFAILGRAEGRPVWEVWGGFGYLIPVLPFAVLWACPREARAMGWVLAGWCLWFGALALVQRRYGNDLAPAAAVGFALVIAAVGRRIAAWLGGSRVAVACSCVAIGLVLLAPPLVFQFGPRLANSLRAGFDAPRARDPALATVAGSLTRFLERVRRVTPETSGFFDDRQEPEYGVVSHANFGHAIQNVARRPTPTDPFWSFIGVANWDAAFALLAASSEAEALALARQLQARYVMTSSSAVPGTVEGWLHYADGRETRRFSATGSFRLVTEGPKRGVHLSRSFQVAGGGQDDPSTLPYKLFERVEGAVLEVRAPPGEEVRASLRLESPSGRRIDYQSRAVANAEGVARLRVPYATGPPLHAEVAAAVGPYRVRSAGTARAVSVTEADVQSGAVVSVSIP